ncbi:hypothetical protein [Snodgrassella gandavensis]|uniref:hypothetical protein n=1 Tax=Snodgrassella gandavensis TaxID=2946698 RepID=UPI001EF3F9CE|nr:hypothetical protein [Snodgrassella gandavensis]
MHKAVEHGYFADALIDIYKHNKSLLDHLEIVQGFIENNNRILDYIHQHNKVINSQLNIQNSFTNNVIVMNKIASFKHINLKHSHLIKIANNIFKQLDYYFHVLI